MEGEADRAGHTGRLQGGSHAVCQTPSLFQKIEVDGHKTSLQPQDVDERVEGERGRGGEGGHVMGMPEHHVTADDSQFV